MSTAYEFKYLQSTSIESGQAESFGQTAACSSRVADMAGLAKSSSAILLIVCGAINALLSKIGGPFMLKIRCQQLLPVYLVSVTNLL
jgi:hypothetical protein